MNALELLAVHSDNFFKNFRNEFKQKKKKKKKKEKKKAMTVGVNRSESFPHTAALGQKSLSRVGMLVGVAIFY